MKLISEEIFEFNENGSVKRTRTSAGLLQRQQMLSTQRQSLSKLEGRLQKVESAQKLRRAKMATQAKSNTQSQEMLQRRESLKSAVRRYKVSKNG